MEWYAALARFCAYRERCSQEVRIKLSGLNVPVEEWAGIFAQLEAENFLNDARYAQSFARGKFRINQWGRIRIRMELRKSGIEPGMVEAAVQEISEEEYGRTLQKLAERKLKELSKDAPVRRREKLFRYLMQKGYEFEVLQEFIREDGRIAGKTS